MRRLHVPAPLRWLLAAVALSATAWALLVPAWQVPDEDAHFAYVQALAELGRRPAPDDRPDEFAVKSTEQDVAERASGFLESHQRIEADPAWSRAAYERWLRAGRLLGEAARRDGGGANPAQANPPLYYAYAALPYAVADDGDVFDRLTLMRLWSVPLLLAFALTGWLLAGELLGRRRDLQLAAAALCGLAPMATFVGAAVTPDALLLPLWGAVLWLSARLLRRGLDARGAVALVVVVVLALATKLTSLALLPGVAWVLGVAAWRRTGRPAPSPRLVGAGLAGAALASAALAAAIVPGGARRFASYLWQFYLPEVPGQQHVSELPQWPLRDVWWETGVAAFGWLEVRLPGWLYTATAVIAGVVVLVAARGLGWRGLRRNAALALALALPVLALLAGVHLAEERMIVEHGRGFAQGRYLLPLLPLAGLVVAGACTSLRPSRRPLAVAAVLGGLTALQLVSLAAVAGRFYA